MVDSTKNKGTRTRHFVKKKRLRINVNDEHFTINESTARDTIQTIRDRGDKAAGEQDMRLAHTYWQAAEHATREMIHD